MMVFSIIKISPSLFIKSMKLGSTKTFSLSLK